MRLKFLIFKKMRGQTLIELIMVMGLAAIILPAILTGLVASREGKPQQKQRMQAITVLKESEVAIRSIKKSNWEAFSTNGTYHTELSGAQWNLGAGEFTNTNGIKQEIIISDVTRDSNGAIVDVGGAIDPSTKKVTINISWSQPKATLISSEMYISRYSNTAFTQTTQSDFNAGIRTDTSVVSTGGSLTNGQIELTAVSGGGAPVAGGSSSDWCVPNLSITALDLPKSGVANAVSAIEGRVFAGTGNNSSGVSFANVGITDTDPPNSSINGTFNGYKTNDVFGEANYGYLATDTNSKEIVIVDLAANPYTEIGHFNAPGNGSGTAVAVSGNIGYMVSGNKLYTFNLSSKSGSRAQLGTMTLDGNGSKIYVNGSYVYVAIDSASNQLEVVQVSNGGATLTKASSFSVAGQNGQSVIVDSSSTRAYLATAVSSSQREMFIINISSKTNPSLVGSYEANGMNPKGLTVVTNNKAILVGSEGEEYQVIDISSEASPTRCGGLEINNGVTGLSSVEEADGDAYSYIITGDSSAELKIIEGGAGQVSQTNWCSPQDSIVRTITLPKRGSAIMSQAASAYVGAGNGSAGEDFIKVGINHFSPPTAPFAAVSGSHSGSNQSNAVFSDGTYAYHAINGTTQQVRILNVTISPYSEVGTITVPSGANANGIYVSGNTAYVTSADKLYAFDVTTKTGGHTTVLGEASMYDGDSTTPLAKQIKVVGTKAFVGTSNTVYGLQVFAVGSNGASLELVGVSDLSWQQSAQGLAVNTTGTRGYVSFNNGTGSVSKGVYIVDTSAVDPPTWWPLPNFYSILGTYDSGSTDPTGVAVASGADNRLLLSGNGGSYQYHVLDISLEANPLLCGGLSVPSGINGIASIQNQYNVGYAYIISNESSNDFKIIQGGTGGGNYIEDGVFESSIFDSGSNSAFNRIVANVSKPPQTTIRMQVAVFPRLSGSCTGAPHAYVGPDGSSTSFFNPSGNTVASEIALGNFLTDYNNPEHCFRYKTWFTTWDTSETPVFNDITVNYSP